MPRFKLRYRVSFGVIDRSFANVKSMTQYVRRNNIEQFRYYCEGKPIAFVGNTMVTLPQLQDMVAHLMKPL